MALTVTFTPFQLSSTEVWTAAKFNQGFNPTVSVTGATTALSDWAATAPTAGYVATWNGTAWAPAALPVASGLLGYNLYAWEHFT